MTFAELLAEVYDDLGYQTAPATAVVTRIKRRINKAQEQLLSDPALASLLNGSMTFASVASQARYGLSNVAQIRILRETTNDRRLFPKSLDWYRTTNPDPASNTGTPSWYVPLGPVAVAQVPAATGTGLWVVSSSASDTALTTTVDAIRVGGYPHNPTAVTLTGTTRAAIGSLTDYIDVTQFQLSAAAVGDVSLYDAAAAGNLLAVIPRGQTTSRYYGVILTQTPSTAITYSLDVEFEIQPLVNDTDESRLPQKFHRLLGIIARKREYELKDDERYAEAKSQEEAETLKLKAYVNNPPGTVLVPGGAIRGVSDVGPQYPAGTIWD